MLNGGRWRAKSRPVPRRVDCTTETILSWEKNRTLLQNPADETAWQTIDHLNSTPTDVGTLAFPKPGSQPSQKGSQILKATCIFRISSAIENPQVLAALESDRTPSWGINSESP